MSQLNSSHHTLYELLIQGEDILKSSHKQDASIDARLLMCHVLQCDKVALILRRTEQIPESYITTYLELIRQRASGIPLQYITKSQAFMALDFYVDERVLIPRQDTETLVETLLAFYKENTFYEIVEVGVGSGCISIALAYYLKNVSITAIDISQDALDITVKNAMCHGVDSKIHCVKSDVFKDYKPKASSIDLIVSNPPYIDKETCEQLMVEVRDHEPRCALTDELDGLSFYRKISKEATLFLRSYGILAYEIGYDQAKAITHILKDEGFCNIQVIQDLAGRDRVIIAQYIRE